MDNKIKPGKYVELTYDLYQTEQGAEPRLVHQSDPSDPEKIIFGVTQGVIEPLEAALDGLSEGDKFEVNATAEQAFGPYDPEHVVTLERDIFVVDGKFDDEVVKVGNAVPMMTADGFRMMGLVKEVTPEKVVMDFNHPLAGKDILFKGQVVTVRDATEEELHPQASCCGGGCSGSCDCDGGDCGEGCGCSSCK